MSDARVRDRCPACAGAGAFEEHDVPACRYGPGPDVRYRGCAGCGSLFIARIPPDLDRHYGEDYYAMAPAAGGSGGLRARIRRMRDQHAVTGNGRLGRGLARLFPPALEGFPAILQEAAPDEDARILDVGSGAGELLVRLRDAGYRRLTGVDPFLPEGLRAPEGVRLVRATVEELAEGPNAEAGGTRFDLVMFHHSLEHVPDPEGALAAARALLGPGGRVLVRTPVVPSEAWERYGTAWAQLDAPRHLTIFSRTGLPLLAGKVGLELVGVQDDSTELQFLGSELYREGRPLEELAARFGWRERRRRRREARELNARGRGDQAAFLFRGTGGGP